MNSKLVVAFLAMSAFTGCVVVGSGGGGGGRAYPGDVTFTWSFAGQSCNDVPNIRSVRISIPGETLQNNGVFPCSANNYPGMVLHDFVPGTYTFTIDALGYANERLYVGSGTFTVNGDVRASIDLTPVGGPNSYAYLTWSFPAASQASYPSCVQAGVRYVDVSIDGLAYVRYDCEQGFSLPGVQTPYLEAGTHSIELVGLTSEGYPLYRYWGALQTFAGNPVSADYALAWGVGGSALRWTLTDGSVSLNCAQAGVTKVSVNFQDESGQLVYGQSGDIQGCDAAPIVYNYLQPGIYRVFVKATNASGSILYLSNGKNPPVVTVDAGVFADASQSLAVQLFRQ